MAKTRRGSKSKKFGRYCFEKFTIISNRILVGHPHKTGSGIIKYVNVAKFKGLFCYNCLK